LGAILAFTAGALNAAGFLAVQRYTSHMTGVVSSMADDLVLGNYDLALAGLAALVSFVAGAMTTALLTNWARRRHMHSEYALSLMLEALLLLFFGVMGASLVAATRWLVPLTVFLLCFIMGLQNAVITKISRAEIRTTHVTGLVTDLGIELGRMVYWNRSQESEGPGMQRVRANREKLAIHTLILGLFFLGGLIGAWAFKHIGFTATIPLAAGLICLAILPVIDDFKARASD
jgi:uncharacterized membrane protein YoaK (UPF0700 family)